MFAKGDATLYFNSNKVSVNLMARLLNENLVRYNVLNHIVHNPIHEIHLTYTLQFPNKSKIHHSGMALLTFKKWLPSIVTIDPFNVSRVYNCNKTNKHMTIYLDKPVRK